MAYRFDGTGGCINIPENAVPDVAKIPQQKTYQAATEYKVKLAMMCKWNVVLSDAEVELLSSGPPYIHPLLVRPEAIVDYCASREI